ncbi:MAG: META domain-containing protein [Alphaproteobacteria bacterium]
MKKVLMVLLAVLVISGCKEEKQEVVLKGHEYKVLNALNNVDLRISFDDVDDRYYGKVINNFNGAYKIDGDTITFGPAMSTMMAGDPEMMKIEYEYLNFFPQVKKYKIEGNVLILMTDEDEVSFEDMGPIQK